jgi:hypothetical protein
VPQNIIANLAYSLNAGNVKTVMCQGDLVVRDRKVLTMDVPALVEESEEPWKKLCLR